MTLHVVDVDGTIGKDKGSRAYIRYLNDRLQLGLSIETLQSLRNYREFTQLEEVQAFVRDNPINQERYKAAFLDAEHDPEVQQALVPARDAVEAVHRLAATGRVIYATCRKRESKERTQRWLAHYYFPSPDQVYICDHYHNKYVQAFHAANQDEEIILIDDHAEEIIHSFRRLAREHTDIALAIRNRLTVVAFGADQAPPNPFKSQLFPVTALPAWKHILEPTGETVV